MINLRKKLKYLLGYKSIKSIYSDISGWIHIVAVFDKPRMIVGGMLQSGGSKIWQKAVNKLREEGQKVNQVLIIGLGCGNCAREIRKRYPKAEMIGVEIDRKVIDMAQCYFSLASIKKLRLAIDDGIKYVGKKAAQKRPKLFNLIIVDVYLGKKMPESFKTKSFLLNLRKLLNKDGVVIYNHLFFKQHKKQAKEFIEKLETVLPNIVLQRTVSNLLIFAKR